ncbi:uncharacterized protein LOC113332426 [Papaver somniferum]|uniref:uncharacterized protein LOC113332426 n=1 Tax=Papaver somniferum TaxID=3469 RepID=UPI000E700C32|nr:uncharacterized protein LOC113332426 [Papaver somniferum]
MHDHRLENLFQEILNFVSIKALKILYDEIHKNVDVGSMNVTCNCLARTVNGLPCACEIGALKRQGKVIPLNIIDPFWRQLSSSPPSPSRINLPFEETPEFFAIRDTWERATENEQVRILAQLKPIAFPCTINLQEPEVSQVHRGRKSKKQLIKDRSTVREPSFYEHIDKTVDILVKFGEKRNRKRLAAQNKDTNLVDPRTMYEQMWGVDMLKELEDSIDNNQWMRMPESGFIIAEAFTTTVVYLSEEQSMTFIPTTNEASPKKQKKKNNFSDNWSEPYMKRIKKYEDMVGTRETKRILFKTSRGYFYISFINLIYIEVHYVDSVD